VEKCQDVEKSRILGKQALGGLPGGGGDGKNKRGPTPIKRPWVRNAVGHLGQRKRKGNKKKGRR